MTRFADLVNGCIFEGRQIVDAKYLKYIPRKKTVIQPKRKMPENVIPVEMVSENVVSENVMSEEVTLEKMISEGVVSEKVLSEKIVSKEVVLSIDEKSIYERKDGIEIDTEEEKITEYLSYTDRERDFIWLHDHPDWKFYIACEGQSEGDYSMSLREFAYDGIEYTDQLESGRHKIKTVEGTKYLLPVFHMVLHHGWKRWLSKHTLQEMMYISKGLEVFRHKIPDYQSYVIDIHEQDPDLFKTEWADIFRLMKHSRKKEELKRYVEEHMDEIRRLSNDTRMLLAVLLDKYEIMNDGKVMVKDMCEAWDGAMQMYAEEAAEKAAKEEREKAEKIIKEIQDEKEQAITKVMEEAERVANKFRKLMCVLVKEQEYEKLERASSDMEFCQELYTVYGI